MKDVTANDGSVRITTIQLFTILQKQRMPVPYPDTIQTSSWGCTDVSPYFHLYDYSTYTHCREHQFKDKENVRQVAVYTRNTPAQDFCPYNKRFAANFFYFTLFTVWEKYANAIFFASKTGSNSMSYSVRRCSIEKFILTRL